MDQQCNYLLVFTLFGSEAASFTLLPVNWTASERDYGSHSKLPFLVCLLLMVFEFRILYK